MDRIYYINYKEKNVRQVDSDVYFMVQSLLDYKYVAYRELILPECTILIVL